MSTNKLIICPVDPSLDPISEERMVEILVKLQFIGGRLGTTEHSYVVGSYFLNCFEIEGHVVVLPEGRDAKGQIHAERLLFEIELSEPNEKIEMLVSALTDDPQCRHCGFQYDWCGLAKAFYDSRIINVKCPHCSHQSFIWQLDWKRTCGFGRFAIEIWHMGHETAPTAKFLQALHEATGQQFDYFYYHL